MWATCLHKHGVQQTSRAVCSAKVSQAQANARGRAANHRAWKTGCAGVKERDSGTRGTFGKVCNRLFSVWIWFPGWLFFFHRLSVSQPLSGRRHLEASEELREEGFRAGLFFRIYLWISIPVQDSSSTAQLTSYTDRWVMLCRDFTVFPRQYALLSNHFTARQTVSLYGEQKRVDSFYIKQNETIIHCHSWQKWNSNSFSSFLTGQ